MTLHLAFVFKAKRADVFLKREGEFFICEGELDAGCEQLFNKTCTKAR
jgi:hypothetical protein